MSWRFLAGSTFVALAVAVMWPRDDARERPTAAAHAPEHPIAVAWTSVHRGESVQANLGGFAEWLAETYAPAEPTFLGADCSLPPCLIGVRFTGKGLAPDEVRALLTGVRAEVERRTGIAMSVIHADEDSAGRHYLWMYGLPAELSSAEQERLRQSAEARYSLRMDPLRRRSEPHVTTSAAIGD